MLLAFYDRGPYLPLASLWFNGLQVEGASSTTQSVKGELQNISELERKEEEAAALISNPFDLVIDVESEQIVFPSPNN